MCTAVSLRMGGHYFGRTLDHTQSHGESVVILPRNCSLPFCFAKPLPRQYALIGIAHMAEGFPLYYDAVNEKGLAMAGLNFVGNARYGDPEEGRCNVAQFELLPWVLTQCATVREADLYKAIRLINREVKLGFDKAGVEIPFQQVVVHQAEK